MRACEGIAAAPICNPHRVCGRGDRLLHRDRPLAGAKGTDRGAASLSRQRIALNEQAPETVKSRGDFACATLRIVRLPLSLESCAHSAKHTLIAGHRVGRILSECLCWGLWALPSSRDCKSARSRAPGPCSRALPAKGRARQPANSLHDRRRTTLPVFASHVCNHPSTSVLGKDFRRCLTPLLMDAAIVSGKPLGSPERV